MSQHKRMSHRGGSRVPLSQPKQQRTMRLSNGSFDTSFYYLPSVMDNLSVDLVHTVGFFDSTKRCVRQVYSLLIAALCRRDPLPRMVREAIESSMRTPPAPHPTPAVPPPPPVEQLQLQKSELETITALDIPYTLRHFDFDLTVANNGDASAEKPGGTVSAVTASLGGAVACGSFSFSLPELKSRRSRGSAELLRACRLVANLLVAMEFSSTVGRAVEGAEELNPPIHRGGSTSCAMESRLAYGNGSCSGQVSRKTSRNGTFSSCVSRRARGSGYYNSRRSSNPAGTYTAPNNAFDTTPDDSSSSSSPMSSTSPPPSLLTPTASGAADCTEFGGGGPTISLSAPLMLTTGLDGSNSNRVTSQMSQFKVQHQSRATTADFTTEERMCPQHLDRSRVEDREDFSCAVCASQHFMHRHMQRLALERGGLARLENALCDCMQLQEQWRRSVSWVAGNVSDRRLPNQIRPLIRCICAEAARDPSGRGVSVNPQVVIGTDGHCSAAQCAHRASGSGSFGISGRGTGVSGNCCWDAPPTL